MKVTAELPDEIFVRSQAVAALRHISLSELLIQALQRKLHATSESVAHICFELDDCGWPVLKNKGSNIQITNAFVN